MNFSFLFIPKNISKIYLSIFRINLFISLILLSCTPTKRILDSENTNLNTIDSDIEQIRVLLVEEVNEYSLIVQSDVFLFDDQIKIAEIKKGNEILFTNKSGLVDCKILDKEFLSNTFQIEPIEEILEINGKKFRGVLKIFERNSEVKVVNQISLEDYVKGVMTREMPVGNGTENYEALKAFSICVRTYALNKLIEKKDLFDIYPDTRDQVYGGAEGETDYTNRIVDETKNQILTYDDKPAKVFYHSTCGGFTEDVKNVFGNQSIPYLISVEDGADHYCKISPRYEWVENYSQETFIDRLFKSNYLDNKNYSLVGVEILSRFESGRVNELKINLLDENNNEKIISLFGNSMRSVIRTSDNKSILRSNYFNVSLDDNNNVIIDGKGSGHGVGMCQWGAIGQSKQNTNYINILNHYFPGTKIQNLYD